MILFEITGSEGLSFREFPSLPLGLGRREERERKVSLFNGSRVYCPAQAVCVKYTLAAFLLARHAMPKGLIPAATERGKAHLCGLFYFRRVYGRDSRDQAGTRREQGGAVMESKTVRAAISRRVTDALNLFYAEPGEYRFMVAMVSLTQMMTLCEDLGYQDAADDYKLRADQLLKAHKPNPAEPYREKSVILQ